MGRQSILLTTIVQVHQLLVVLAKKKDPISQVTFLEAIDGVRTPLCT